MALVPMKKLLENVEKNNIAVGAFSVGNMEMVMGAVAAAEELNMPIILQIAECRLKNSPLELMGPMMVSAAKNSKVDIAVHLDHGLRVETVQKALELGFTSVMFDGSTLPLEENIKTVKQVREMADKYGATVEAELGVVGGNEGDGAAHEVQCTNPDDAKLSVTKQVLMHLLWLSVTLTVIIRHFQVFVMMCLTILTRLLTHHLCFTVVQEYPTKCSNRQLCLVFEKSILQLQALTILQNMLTIIAIQKKKLTTLN